MAIIQLLSDYPTHTAVPNAFIEHHMTTANGEFVKIYLYLLRLVQGNATDFSISSIADFFSHTEKDIERALKYWEKENVLSITYGEDSAITGIQILSLERDNRAKAELPPSTPSVAKKAKEAAGTKKSVAKKSDDRPQYSLEQIQEFQKDPAVSELFFVLESYLRKPFSSNDTQTVYFWYEELKFSPELIEYLVEYCITKGRSSFRYMDKVALAWKEEGITSIEQAKSHAALHSQAYYAVMKAFGITGRSLVESENAYITKWTKEFAFDLEIVEEACRRTIAAIHQPSFQYADSILTKWHQQNVHTITDIQKVDETFRPQKISVQTTDDAAPKKNAFTNFEQRSYDMDDIERMLLTTPAP